MLTWAPKRSLRLRFISYYADVAPNSMRQRALCPQSVPAWCAPPSHPRLPHPVQWEAVSENAKAMITQMLVLDETQRSTAATLLKVSSHLRSQAARKHTQHAGTCSIRLICAGSVRCSVWVRGDVIVLEVRTITSDMWNLMRLLG
jgi:hypothetical protein